MWKSIRTGVLCVATLIALVPIAAAKKAQNPPAAPIPAQIFTAKKIFIANGGSTVDTFGIPSLTYDEFYAGMKSWGKFELVPSPADADLVYEISFDAPIGAVEIPQLFADKTYSVLQLRLVILDPTTHVVLWRFTEHVEAAALQSTWRKNFDRAETALADDVKALTTPVGPAASTPAPAQTKKANSHLF
jgi:hypothetical protein